MVAALIAHNYATLKELQTYYSYTDMLDMFEVLTVKNYNEWFLMEEQKKKNNG